MKRIPLALLALTLLIPFSTASAHRSGCHRWHSCPSDTGSYVCGDLGYTSQCPKATAPKQKVPVVSSVKNSTSTLNKSCLASAIKVGNVFLLSKGYKENKDGSWTNSKGSYPTSKVSNDVDTKETEAYNKCLKTSL
jgi:hypothetical protein